MKVENSLRAQENKYDRRYIVIMDDRRIFMLNDCAPLSRVIYLHYDRDKLRDAGEYNLTQIGTEVVVVPIFE